MRVARAERAVGLLGEALAHLDRALREAAAAPLRPADPTLAAGDIDFRSMEQENRVGAELEVAAELEAAGESQRGRTVLAQALADLAGIASAQWRGYAWRNLVRAYRTAGRLDRGLEVLLTGAPANPDKNLAITDPSSLSADEILAGPGERRWQLLAALPPGLAKVELISRLAVEIAKWGDGGEAARMVAAGLSTIAARPEGWVAGLIALAGEAPGVDRPGDDEQRRKLQSLLDAVPKP